MKTYLSTTIIYNPRIDNDTILSHLIDLFYEPEDTSRKFIAIDLFTKKLAYDVQGYKEGHYITVYTESNMTNYPEYITSKIREHDNNILKFIVLKEEDENNHINNINGNLQIGTVLYEYPRKEDKTAHVSERIISNSKIDIRDVLNGIQVFN